MVFATDYTWYFASRLIRKFKPNYGKTKGLGGLRISRFVAKPFIKLIDKTVYKIVTRAPAPDEKPEYFKNLYEMKVFAENEEDLFSEALNSKLAVSSHEKHLERIHTGLHGQLHSHYQLKMAEVFLLDKVIVFEMYVQLNSTEVGSKFRTFRL